MPRFAAPVAAPSSRGIRFLPLNAIGGPKHRGFRELREPRRVDSEHDSTTKTLHRASQCPESRHGSEAPQSDQAPAETRASRVGQKGRENPAPPLAVLL